MNDALDNACNAYDAYDALVPVIPAGGNGTTQCLHCGLAFTPRRKTASFCTAKCRIAHWRLSENPSEAKQHARTVQQSNRRSAITNCAAGTGRLRDVGLATPIPTLITRDQKNARKAIRKAARQKRTEIKKSYHMMLRDITIIMKAEIIESDIAISKKYDDILKSE